MLAMMASVSTSDIRPLDWWPRAKSALEAAASGAETWSQMVSIAAGKLQVEALRLASSGAVCAIGRTLARRSADWERFRSLCERDAIYIVAMAQVTKDAARPRKAGEA